MSQPEMEPIAADSSRLHLITYPFISELQTRWSDLRCNRIGDVSLPLYFEDARGTLLRQLLGEAGYAGGTLPVFMARLRIDFCGAATFPDTLTIGSGVGRIGTTSYTFSQAAFQQGECVALCESFAVAVGSDRRPQPIPPTARLALESALIPSVFGREASASYGKPGADRHRPDTYKRHYVFSTRFPDTDAMGHINNVAMLRYYEDGRMLMMSEAVMEVTPRLLQADVTYLSEATYPKPLTIACGVRAIGADSFQLVQALFQEGRCIGTCDAVLAAVDSAGARTPFRPAMHDWLESCQLKR